MTQDERMRRAIKEAERAGVQLVPRPPDSVLEALRVVACVGSVVHGALVSIAVRLKVHPVDAAWREQLRTWLDEIGAGLQDWSGAHWSEAPEFEPDFGGPALRWTPVNDEQAEGRLLRGTLRAHEPTLGESLVTAALQGRACGNCGAATAVLNECPNPGCPRYAILSISLPGVSARC